MRLRSQRVEFFAGIKQFGLAADEFPCPVQVGRLQCNSLSRQENDNQANKVTHAYFRHGLALFKLK